MVLLFFIVGLIQSQSVRTLGLRPPGCEDGWTEFNGSCYKYFDTPQNRGTFDVLRARCQALGADIASGAKQHEREFLHKQYRLFLNGRFPDIYQTPSLNWEHLLVGVNYAKDGRWTKISVNKNETVDGQFRYCAPNEPNYYKKTEYCHYMYASDRPGYAPFCMVDVNCNFNWRRYICRKEQPRILQPIQDSMPANNPPLPRLQSAELQMPVWSRDGCDDGWTEYNGSCYKHFDTPSNYGAFSDIRNRCKALGGDIASGAKQHEREFMDRLNRPSFNGRFPYVYQQDWQKWESLLVGVNYAPDGSWRKISVNKNETVDDQFRYCPGEPNRHQNMEYCHYMYSSDNRYYAPFCMVDVNCNFKWRRYICRKVKPLACEDKNAVAKDGKCVCKEGFVDILETEEVEKDRYKEGEKCVPEDPCRSLKQSLSLIFIIDASQSIQERNWPSLVDFVKSASNLIPNQVNVGFIKFSSNVSFAEWLPIQWSKREFQQMVPTEFDAGYTNTPGAIEKAIEMFDENGRKTDKVAVLITDGLPVVDETTDKQTALDDTRQAISKLHRKGIDIVALGFGPELVQQRGDTYIKKWLEDPREDYFSFNRMACDLRRVHMQILLQKVCRRYV